MKIPKKLSTEELLESLENSEYVEEDSVESDHVYSDILKFISKFDLDKGEYSIHIRFIYNLYRSFARTPISYNDFKPRFRVVYPHKVEGVGFYSVNKNIVNILKLIEQTGSRDRFIRSKYNPKLLNTLKTFLSDLDIQPGEYWVESFILSELYEDYREKHNKPKYRKTHLISAMSLYFKTINTKHGNFMWFKLNKKALDLFTEVRYNEYIETKGLAWWKNLPEEVAITEASERRKKAKDAISAENRRYKLIRKKLKKRRDARKNTQLSKLD